MSEPARQLLPNDLPVRPQPGPLRDWLASMKAKNAAEAAAVPEPDPAPVPASASTLPAPLEAGDVTVAMPDESELLAWAPATVTTPAAIRLVPQVEITMELSELMAENMMLKAKLRVENERYDSLQAILAEEMGSLRSRFETDMRILDEVCAERDQLKSLTATVARKMRDMRTEMEAEAERLAEACSERDLWMARAEALAQPLFQSKDRAGQKNIARLPEPSAN